ncbi:MAG: DUF2892 domain-containing protein [Persephonella sp.]|jgi:hypothetical protein|nr:MAG: DUF2892 domain-containing protein [Persephonella sp.]RUM61316.1 MAG: DUF2892 domain-containing protein [Persephonella sp.]
MSKKAMRVQRFVMGSMLLVALLFFLLDMKTVSLFIIGFMIFMLYLSAFTGFCPSDAIFEKLFGEKKSS